MSLSNWRKIDLADHQSEVDSLMNAAAVEGAFVNRTGSCIQGDLYDELEIQCLVNISNRGFKVSCSKCGSFLCAHAAVLIQCFLNEGASFEQVDHVQVPKDWSSPLISFKKLSPKPARKKSLKKRFLKMIEGLDLCNRLINEFLLLPMSRANRVSRKSLKQSIFRLDEFYLPGLKMEFLALLDLISFSGENEEFLEGLAKINRLVNDSKIELTECLSGTCIENPYSSLTTARGHVWKITELESPGGVCDASLIQLNFSSTENLIYRRVEENGVWLDLNSGEIYLTKNYRPFKALRFIPEGDSEYSVLDCGGLVKYPGSGNRRIRWKSEIKKDVSSGVILQILSLAKKFDSEEQKRLKAELRRTSLEDGFWGFYKVDAFRYDSGCSIAVLSSQSYVLNDSQESKLLRAYNSSDLSNSACLFKFRALKNEIDIQPLCIVTEKKIIRLGF